MAKKKGNRARPASAAGAEARNSSTPKLMPPPFTLILSK